MSNPFKGLRVQAILTESQPVHGWDKSVLKLEFKNIVSEVPADDLVRCYVGQTFEFELADDESKRSPHCKLPNGKSHHNSVCDCPIETECEIDPDMMRELATLKVCMISLCVTAFFMCVVCGISMVVVLLR